MKLKLPLNRKLDDSKFEQEIAREIIHLEGDGYVSMPVIRLLYNIFSWVYLDSNVLKNKMKLIKHPLMEYLLALNLNKFKGPSVAYSTILLYNRMSREIDIRELEQDVFMEKEKGGNKKLVREDYDFDVLYNMYRDSDIEIPDDLLDMNDLFVEADVKDVGRMRSYGEVVKAVSKSRYLYPDFHYKMATKSFSVNKNVEDEAKEKRKLFILQDCTLSMQYYSQKLLVLKGYILNQTLKQDYEVHWLFVSHGVVKEMIYNRENINDVPIEVMFEGRAIDIPHVLTEERFLGQNVIIISDGTDDFQFNFNTKAKRIDTVLFNENNNLKIKMLEYGRVKYFLGS